MMFGSTSCALTRTGAALALLLLAPGTARAQVTVEYFMGTAVNAPTPLTITQIGFPDISFTGDYSVRPLDGRIYYALRVGFWNERAGWLVELLHHKLYLENTTPEVEAFEVTHGYNMITVNRAWQPGGFMVLAGGGLVIPHSNSLVRGRERSIDAPYTLAGVAAQGAVARQLQFTPWLFGTIEGKLTAAWAKVPVADGDATVPNVALHVLVGIGTRF
jgi:hypothetical protein